MKTSIRTKHQIVAGVEADLLKRVRVAGGLSRARLARELHLAPSTVGIYVDRLVNEGFLLERETEGTEAGRRLLLLTPDPSAGRFIGIDFEPHGLTTVSADFGLEPVRRSHRAIPSGEPLERILKKIEGAVESAIEGDARPVLGIGLGVPGSIDAEKGIASSDCDYIAGWDNVPLGPMLEERFGIPVRLENNIRSMAMAELWLGHGRSLSNFVCLGARTGVCAGVVVNGQLMSGAHGGAGEVGFWPAPEGRGNLDSVGTLDAILAAGCERAGREIDFTGLKEAADRGEARIIDVLKEAAEVHAVVIHQLHMLFDPETVIVVGPLAELGAVFLAPLKAGVRRRSPRTPPPIVNSTFGRFGGALGAAALALHQWKPAR